MSGLQCFIVATGFLMIVVLVVNGYLFTKKHKEFRREIVELIKDIGQQKLKKDKFKVGVICYEVTCLRCAPFKHMHLDDEFTAYIYGDVKTYSNKLVLQKDVFGEERLSISVEVSGAENIPLVLKSDEQLAEYMVRVIGEYHLVDEINRSSK